MPFCGSDLKKKCWKKSRIAQTLMETLDKRCCFICLARPYVGPWVVTSSHTHNPHHNPALMTQIKLATVPRNITAQLNFTLLAPLKLHREVLQHLVEMATTPKSVLVSGQSAEHFLVMRYPMSLPNPAALYVVVQYFSWSSHLQVLRQFQLECSFSHVQQNKEEAGKSIHDTHQCLQQCPLGKKVSKATSLLGKQKVHVTNASSRQVK